MQGTIAEAIEELKAQGIKVEIEPSDMGPDVYIATAPNGDKYDFLASVLVKLKVDGKLNAAGLAQAAHKPTA